MRGVRHADGKPHPDECVKKAYFGFVEREGGVIAGDYGARRGQRIFFSQDSVCGRNRDFGNGKTVVHVSKIDHTDNFSRLRPGRTHQDVVIVGVAVDDAVAQRRQCRKRLRFVQPKKPLDQGPPCGIPDVSQIISNPACAREVPFQFPLGGRMRKIREGSFHLAEKLAETAQQLRTAGICFGEDGSRNIREQPEKALRSI